MSRQFSESKVCIRKGKKLTCKCTKNGKNVKCSKVKIPNLNPKIEEESPFFPYLFSKLYLNESKNKSKKRSKKTRKTIKKRK